MENPYDFKDVYMELHGQKRLYIENYKRLLKYTDQEIVLQTHRGTLLLKGKRLFIREYTKEEIRVDGFVDKILFQN